MYKNAFKLIYNHFNNTNNSLEIKINNKPLKPIIKLENLKPLN
jgi:hypothetical protein